MELFVVNRYLGHDQEEDYAPDEEHLKKKLLQKIEERKKSLENKVPNAVLTLKSDEGKKKTKDKEARKRKSSETLENTLNDENNFNPIKLKKKKSKSLENDSSCNTTEEVNISNIKKSKKKKRKGKEDENKVEEVASDKEESSNETIDENSKIVSEESLEENALSQPFLVLGKDQSLQKQKLKRVLPSWLAKPSIVSVDLKNLTHTVDSIPLLEKIFVKKLRDNNITHFFPVQIQLIPWLLNNINNPSMYWSSDICVSAPTGSGKTLAFVLPILQALHKRLTPQIRAIIVLPVQELANQVFKVFETYCSSTNLKIVLLTKMRSLKDEQKLLVKYDEINGYENLADIIVSTPGRLVDHLNSTSGIHLQHLRFIVIDEADRVMENMQNDWLAHLNNRVNEDYSKYHQAPVPSLINLTNRRRPPQKLLFSATLSQDPEKLQQLGLFQPKLFTSFVKCKTDENSSSLDHKEKEFVGKFTTPAELKEYFTICTKASKPLVILHLMQKLGWKNILCFVNSVESTNRLTFLLKELSRNKVKIAKISAKLDIQKRNKIISKFAKGIIDVLISSDSLARGIDISNVKYVISYDRPKYVKVYIHRIGRTGRAGKEGSSLILLTHDEVKHFLELLEAAGKNSVFELNISRDELVEYEKSFGEALTKVKKKLEISQSRMLAKRKVVKFPSRKSVKKKPNKLNKSN